MEGAVGDACLHEAFLPKTWAVFSSDSELHANNRSIIPSEVKDSNS